MHQFWKCNGPFRFKDGIHFCHAPGTSYNVVYLFFYACCYLKTRIWSFVQIKKKEHFMETVYASEQWSLLTIQLQQVWRLISTSGSKHYAAAAFASRSKADQDRDWSWLCLGMQRVAFVADVERGYTKLQCIAIFSTIWDSTVVSDEIFAQFHQFQASS